MKITYKKIFIFVLLFFILLLIWFRYNEDNKYEKQGKELIDKVEEFRSINGRLPNTIIELGLKEPMNNGPYYKKKTLYTMSYFLI